MKDKKIIIMGKSAAGKDYLAKLLVKLGLVKVVTYTTRPIRTGETEDIDYHYISEEEFKKKIENNEFIEYRTYNTVKGVWYYGSSLHCFEEGDFIILTPEGYKNIKDKLNEQFEIITVLLTADDELRKERSIKRGDNPEEVERRILADNKDFENAFKMVDIIYDTTKWSDRDNLDVAYFLTHKIKKNEFEFIPDLLKL